MILTTDRLVLREFVEADAPAVLAYQSDPRYLRFYHWEDRQPDDVRDFVDMFIRYQHEQPRYRFQLAIVLRDEDCLIGNCGIRKDSPDARTAEIGYELNPKYWGQGYATEAARAILAFGFDALQLHRVAANCLAENVASAHVLEKLSMRLEGRLRENEWFKGRWWDTLVYAILESETDTRQHA